MTAFLDGKVVAITGAGGGIGRAVALAAAAEGKHHIETVWGRGYVLRDPHERGVVVAA